MSNISKELNNRLEQATQTGEANIENLDVIGLFQSKDKEISLFAIAKDVNYIYGILESKDKPNKVGGYPISNLDEVGLFEKFTVPFNSGEYIHNKVKKFKAVDLNYHYQLDSTFRNRILKLHRDKSENFLAKYADNWLLSLGFSTGLDSIPIAVKTTNMVSSHKKRENEEIEFVNVTGFLNLPRFLDIVTLLPLLSQNCYKATCIQDLYAKIETSQESQLLCFRQTIQKKCSEKALNELVQFVNRQELNPDMSNENIDIKDLNKTILSLNRVAYENIFSKYSDV